MANPKSPSPDEFPNMRIPERGKEHSRGYSLEGEAKVSTVWEKGDRVLAPWEPIYLYAGTIETVKDGRALIEFDDGDSGWVELAHVQALQFKPGQRVLSRRRMGPHFFPAVIKEASGENLALEFDDGQEEHTTVAAARIPCEPKGRGAEQLQARSHMAFLQALRKGDRVWALWRNTAFFPGTVSTLRDDDADILFDDGDRAQARLEHLMPLELISGMPVMGRWQMGPHFFPGRLTEVDGERIHIRYEDGDEEWTTPAALALPLQTAPAPAHSPASAPQGNKESGWDPRMVLVIGGVALAIVALLGFWVGRL